MPEHVNLSITEFLKWVDERPRTYSDVMEAWRSTCPRLSTWEDALHEGFVQRIPGSSMNESKIILTDTGRAALLDALADQ